MDAPLSRSGGTRARRLLAEAALLVLVVATALFAVRSHERADAPTFDEAIHLFSGAEALEDGSGWLNPEHPPLLKLAGALALRPLRLATPCSIAPCDVSSPFNGYLRWLYANAAPAHAIVHAGRRPFPWLLALLALTLYLAARSLAGPAAGILAAGVVALDPTFVAHAAYVHTDVGAALGFLAVTVLAARAACRASLVWWLGAGLALGLALATKFSAVLLVPVVAAAPFLTLVPLPGQPAARPARDVTRDRVVGAFVALSLASIVLYAVSSFVVRNMAPQVAESAVRSYLEGRDARPDEVSLHGRLAGLSPPVGHWAGGLAGVRILSERGRGANWFRGETSEEGFPLYFPAVFLLKSTPAFLVLLAAAASIAARRLRSAAGPDAGPSGEPARAVLLAGVVAVGYFAVSTTSAFNIGARHLLPAWALLAFAASVVLGRRLAPRRRGLAAAVLVAATGASLASAAASPIAYFNVLAGGSEGGRRWFSDSNVDWGQDLYRLHLFLAERGWEETTTIVAYSGVATDYYSRRCRLLDTAKPFGPGRYAVSHVMETLGYPFTKGIEGEAAARQVEALVKELRARGRRIALVGGSITVWELPG